MMCICKACTPPSLPGLAWPAEVMYCESQQLEEIYLPALFRLSLLAPSFHPTITESAPSGSPAKSQCDDHNVALCVCLHFVSVHLHIWKFGTWTITAMIHLSMHNADRLRAHNRKLHFPSCAHRPMYTNQCKKCKKKRQAKWMNTNHGDIVTVKYEMHGKNTKKSIHSLFCWGPVILCLRLTSC